MFFAFWIGFALAVAALAKHRGRSPVGWFIAGLFSSLFAAVILLLLPPPPGFRNQTAQLMFDALSPEGQQRVLQAEAARAQAQPRSSGMILGRTGQRPWDRAGPKRFRNAMIAWAVVLVVCFFAMMQIASS
jgi:hypothetical protein